MILPLASERIVSGLAEGPREIWRLALESEILRGGEALIAEELLGLVDPELRSELAVLLLLLFIVRGEGGLCLRLERSSLQALCRRNLSNPAGDYSSENNLSPADIIDRALDELKTPLEPRRLLADYGALLGDRIEDFRPLSLRTEGEECWLYFHRYRSKQRIIDEGLRQYLQEVPAPDSERNLPSTVLNRIFRRHPLRNRDTGAPIEFTAGQQRAVLLGLLQPFLIITGGPGTGKTTIILNILRGLLSLGHSPDRILLAAPTGRAARRLLETITSFRPAMEEETDFDESDLNRIRAVTIHRLLGVGRAGIAYRRRIDSRHGRDRKLPADVVIIDETSMVDLELMSDLFKAIDPRRTRLILVGDRHQLPSVEAGAVLSDLIRDLLPMTGDGTPESLTDRIVLLEKSHRFDSELSRAATYVLQPDPEAGFPWRPLTFDPAMDFDSRRGVFHIQAGGRADGRASGGANDTERLIDSWLENMLGPAYLEAAERLSGGVEDDTRLSDDFPRLLRLLNKFRVLSVLRRGRTGVEALNRRGEIALRRKLNWRLKSPPPGLPIILRRNNASREIFNGDTGVVIHDLGGDPQVLFEGRNGFRRFRLAELPPWENAFAQTVHQSQGSEYENVLLVLPENPEHRLLSREILYTGLTRARQAVYIHGSGRTLLTAVNRQVIRETGKS